MKKYRYLSYVFGLMISHNLYAANLTVTVENIQNDDGTIHIALFTKSGGFPDPSTKTQGIVVPADKKGFVEVVFSELTENDYAIAVYHDENNNKKLDKNFFGIPKEPYGFSGNHTGMAPPDFNEASSHLTNEDLNLMIRLK